MSARIAIPEPTSLDASYNQQTLPQYSAAVAAAGAIPVVIPLQTSQAEVARLLASVQGVLLPGSGFDVDPQAYGEERIAACGDPDPGRAAVDELLLQDAFNLHKPILSICYGTQALNVWRNGSLIQDLPSAGKIDIDHAIGKAVSEAHGIHFAAGSLLAGFCTDGVREATVNSSHHQAVLLPGDNLRVTAISTVDGVTEAIELDSGDHFVLGVQWHPERTYETSELSRAIFRAFVEAVKEWRPRASDLTRPA